MQPATIIKLLSLTSVVKALPSLETAPSSEVGVEMGWIGQVHIGGPKIRLNGTAKGIHDQILELNPRYEEDFKATYGNKVEARGEVPWGYPPRPINDGNVNCRPPVQAAYPRAIADGISYLYWLDGGSCIAPPGRPGAGGCARTTCIDDSAIWFCNDLPFELNLPCFLIADNAIGIWGNCADDRGLVRGHIFSFDYNWGVAVGWSTCAFPARIRPWD